MPYDPGVIRDILIAQLQVIPTLVVAFLLVDRRRRSGRTYPEWERERDRLRARKAYAVERLAQEGRHSGTITPGFKETLEEIERDASNALRRHAREEPSYGMSAMVLFGVAGITLMAVLAGLLAPGPVNADIIGRDLYGLFMSALAVLAMITVIAYEAFRGINPDLDSSRVRAWMPFVGTAAVVTGAFVLLISR